jgi:hypothetical protein
MRLNGGKRYVTSMSTAATCKEGVQLNLWETGHYPIHAVYALAIFNKSMVNTADERLLEQPGLLSTQTLEGA